MKASFFCTNTYLSAEPFRYRDGRHHQDLPSRRSGLSQSRSRSTGEARRRVGFDCDKLLEHHSPRFCRRRTRWYLRCPEPGVKRAEDRGAGAAGLDE